MKVVILAGGFGTRMKKLTSNFPKHMLPIAGKPILEWNIEFVRDELNLNEIIIINGFKGDLIEDYFGNGNKYWLNIKYISQDLSKTMGLAAALKCAEEELDDIFIVLLGDNLYNGGFKKIISEHIKNKANITLHAEEVNNPSRYGVINLIDKNDNKIQFIEEKPNKPKSNLVITGFYVFDRTIFEGIENIQPSQRGELELTDAINHVCKMGKTVLVNRMNGWRRDIGYEKDLLEASYWMFDNQTKSRKMINSEMDESNKLIHPIYVGINCVIKNSKIGPYTSIGDNVRIINSKIMYSTILDEAEIKDEIIEHEIY